MAKKATDPKERLVTLAGNIADHLSVRESGGDLAVQICTDCAAVYHDAPIPNDDKSFLLDEVARQMGWRESSVRVRKAETDAILKAYVKLPDAVTKAREHKSKGKPVPFSDAVKLARLLNGGKNVRDAVAAFVNGASNRASDPKTRSKAEGMKSIKGHVERILQFTQCHNAAQRKALQEWAASIGCAL